MDSITQATLGAAVGEALLGKKIGRKAAVVGAIGGTIPDLDVLLTPFFTEIQKISIHRGYSHSILFCLLGAFLLAYFLSKMKWTKIIAYGRLWIFSFLALFTHVLLDAFTSYGTQLFLPFTDWRVSFDSINIIDPFYSVPLLLGILISVFLHKKLDVDRAIPNLIGLGVSTVYLLFTLGHKQHITNSIKFELAEQNINYNEVKSIPVGVGNINWYGVAKNRDTLYIGKYSDIRHNHADFHKFPINDSLLSEVDEILIDKLKWFAQGFYTVAENNGKIRMYNLQCDMQGVREFGNYKAPTAFYYEITPHADGTYELSSGMHSKGVVK